MPMYTGQYNKQITKKLYLQLVDIFYINLFSVIEYWSGIKENFIFPKNLAFDSKLDTDLFEFAKNKTFVISLTFSQDGKKFATLSSDRRIRVFNFLTGKLVSIQAEFMVCD